MKPSNLNSETNHQKASPTINKSDINLRRETTLYFQIGLILCLLMSYFALEFSVTTAKPELAQLNVADDILEIAPEPFKVYKAPEPLTTLKPKTNRPILNPVLTPIDNQSQTLESNIIDEDFKDTYKDLDPGAVEVYTVSSEVVIPEAFVQNAPVFPGCETAATNEDSKKCFSSKLQKLIQKHFNTDIAQEYGLTGKQHIGVQFKIDSNGEVTEIQTRAPHPALEKEAVRVLQKIPKMKPGKQNNTPVSVQYAVPINFVIQQ